MSDNNLVGELVGDMQRLNHPSVFGVDSNGNQTGSSQNPMGMQGQHMNQMGQVGQQQQMGQQQMGQQQMGQQQMGGAPNGGQENPAQINPDLQRGFMMVLQQSPRHQQLFADPQAMQKAMQNPGVMMNTIAEFQQMQSQMAQQQQQQQQQQPPQQQQQQHQQQQQQQPQDYQNQGQPDSQQEEDDDDDDVTPNQMIGSLKGPVQYEDDVGEVDIPDGNKTEKTFFDKLMDDLKMPLISTIIFIILSNLSVREFIIKSIPKIQDSLLFQTLTFAGLFFTSSFLAKKVFDMA